MDCNQIPVTALSEIHILLTPQQLADALLHQVLRRYLNNPTFDDAGCDWATNTRRDVYVGNDWLVLEHNVAAAALIDAYNTLKYGVPRHC